MCLNFQRLLINIMIFYFFYYKRLRTIIVSSFVTLALSLTLFLLLLLHEAGKLHDLRHGWSMARFRHHHECDQVFEGLTDLAVHPVLITSRCLKLHQLFLLGNRYFLSRFAVKSVGFATQYFVTSCAAQKLVCNLTQCPDICSHVMRLAFLDLRSQMPIDVELLLH